MFTGLILLLSACALVSLAGSLLLLGWSAGQLIGRLLSVR